MSDNSVIDKTWEAVEEAVMNGWTVEKFLHEVRSSWVEAHRQNLAVDVKQLDGAIKGCKI